MVAKIYTVGTTVRVTAETRDSSDLLTDVSSIVVTIFDFEEAAKVTEVDMSRESTGKYYYNWQASVNDDVGLYKVVIKVVASDGKINIKAIYLFELRNTVDS